MSQLAQTASTAALRQDAEALAASYPALLAEAERVAAVVSQGVHGRRRPGQGETFWQYRPYNVSDTIRQVDWRRSARGNNLYVRDNEWEAANTVYFWRDGQAGMDWTSDRGRNTKQTRASVLGMALAILLMQAGERCAVIGESERARSGKIGLERVTRTLAMSDGNPEQLDAELPRHARIIILSDFLEGSDVWRARLARLAARPAHGILVHLVDPAEREFPYKGRMRLSLPGQTSLPPLLVGRAEKAKEAYQNKFAAHCDTLARTARRLNWPLITHQTDQNPNLALTSIYQVLSGEAG